MKEKWYKDGLRFSCARCSFCCGNSPGFVYLSWRDLDALCGFFKMSRTDFVEKYCRWVNYYYGKQVLALREMKNYDCALWKDGCTAYEARPVQCSTWPFWSWMVESRASWDECAAECPGMNHGKLISFSEIEENRIAYEHNQIDIIEQQAFFAAVNQK